jgi:hypothetical protein
LLVYVCVQDQPSLLMAENIFLFSRLFKNKEVALRPDQNIRAAIQDDRPKSRDKSTNSNIKPQSQIFILNHQRPRELIISMTSVLQTRGKLAKGVALEIKHD